MRWGGRRPRQEAAAGGMTVSNTDDQLVAGYLGRLAAAAASLPADRRDELIEEISAHIAEARAVSPDATGDGGLGAKALPTRWPGLVILTR